MLRVKKRKITYMQFSHKVFVPCHQYLFPSRPSVTSQLFLSSSHRRRRYLDHANTQVRLVRLPGIHSWQVRLDHGWVTWAYPSPPVTIRRLSLASPRRRLRSRFRNHPSSSILLHSAFTSSTDPPSISIASSKR